MQSPTQQDQETPPVIQLLGTLVQQTLLASRKLRSLPNFDKFFNPDNSLANNHICLSFYHSGSGDSGDFDCMEGCLLLPQLKDEYKDFWHFERSLKNQVLNPEIPDYGILVEFYKKVAEELFAAGSKILERYEEAIEQERIRLLERAELLSRPDSPDRGYELWLRSDVFIFHFPPTGGMLPDFNATRQELRNKVTAILKSNDPEDSYRKMIEEFFLMLRTSLYVDWDWYNNEGGSFTAHLDCTIKTTPRTESLKTSVSFEGTCNVIEEHHQSGDRFEF